MYILFAQAEVWSGQKDRRARPSTYRTAEFNKDGRRARPSLPTLPGTDGTIGRQGPGVRTGRLGTFFEKRKVFLKGSVVVPNS